MADQTVKRGYAIPAKLAARFRSWCKPGRELGSNVAGAMVVWMTLPADIREQAEKAAYADDLNAGVGELHKALCRYFRQAQ